MKLFRQRNRQKNKGSTSKAIVWLWLVITTGLQTATAQTLFTYGGQPVSRQEFLSAYSKNNNDSNATRTSYADYLELYIRFKLKVRAALDAKMDTLPQQKAELQSFHQQLSESYLKEDASINLLVDEAAERSLSDIHLSHIFIPVPKTASPAEINRARENINAVYEKLKKGAHFNEAGASFQTAHLGYITAFVLPYAFESIAYATPEGSFSRPFQTSNGFHILRNNKVRKAIGKVRVSQILLAFPPGASEPKQQEIAVRADSVYQVLKGGADFSRLAQQISDDRLTFQSGGEMPPFGVGIYDTVFENAAFALRKDGDISRPVRTSFGYHILSRIQHIPVTGDPADKNWKAMIREQVLQSDRMQVAQARLVQNIRQKLQKDAAPADLASDSAVLEYYRKNLEKYNAEFAGQMKEFREGNLLFNIMQQKVWDAATEDTTALHVYYQKNKQKYYWENSADALIITCMNAKSLEETQTAAKNRHHEWRQWTEVGSELIQVDSGRFELSQIPVLDRTNFTEGLVTAPITNEQDSSKTFAYIIKIYNEREPKKYEDAKGSVINDYQNYLEEQWVAALKEKYPVRVRKKVLNSLPAR